jgi:putative sterol carrier protein
MSESVNSNTNIEQIITKLPSRFQSEQAADLSVVYQFNLSEQLSFYIDIDQGQCLTKIGEHDDPNITLTMDQATFIALMAGEIDGMSAFMKGQLKAHGNVILATSLGKLFKKKQGDNDKIKVD